MSALYSNRYIHGFLGLLLAIVVYFQIPDNVYPMAPAVGAMVTLMAIFWIFEIIPIPVTSLFPLFFLPFFNVADAKTVGTYYGKPIIFLFLGGFLLALGLQQSGIHKRIALHIVKIVGSQPSRLVLGFMLATGLLSMWISNTASVIVMLPIALSILEQCKEHQDDKAFLSTFGACLMLGIAYSADIGGMASLIGTPPNLVFLELYSTLFPDGPSIGFLDWMLMALPISIAFMGCGWFLLTHFIFKLPKEAIFQGDSIIQNYLDELGKIRRDEVLAGLIFATAAILWMTGSDIRINANFQIPGWRSLLGLAKVSDASIAVAVASLLFIIPSKDRKGETLLEWEAASKIPWGILLLFGGGFAIAGGFQISGLSEMIGELFANVSISSPIIVVAFICTILTFLTEITSNTAMTNLVLPILAKASVAMGINPILIMIPATLSASCAFMMPIASPTQAIVFGSGYVNIRQMVKAGIWFNILGIILVTVGFLLVGKVFLGIEMGVMPEWALPTVVK